MSKDDLAHLPAKVDATVSGLAARLAHEVEESFQNEFCDLGIESPIEQLMGAALLFWLKSREMAEWNSGRTKMFQVMPVGRFEELNPDWQTRFGGRHGIQIHPQFPIGKYTADFFVEVVDWRQTHVMGVIECDGHDYHERTKQQAQHDKARDRYFQSLGLIVLRYTGSEIHKNPMKAAYSAMEILQNRADAAGRSPQ
jgi:very-short-patch-repair endonuclease